MKKNILLSFVFTLLVSVSAFGVSTNLNWDINYISFKDKKIRSGFLPSALNKSKGHIIYFQGLGDSMMNHQKLFNELLEDGFNVIAFDYLGQGKSTGSMNRTSISNIGDLADIVWDFYVKKPEKKKIIGWSTGGLAAYRYAYKKPNEVESIAMIAPGIAPRLIIGDKMFITEETLIQKEGLELNNPHIDPAKPNTPLKAPLFATNLLYTSMMSQKWKIDLKVKGIVFLSDNEDSYVNPERTKSIIKKNASHFQIKSYDGSGALHELDNEIESVSSDLIQEALKIFNQ